MMKCKRLYRYGTLSVILFLGSSISTACTPARITVSSPKETIPRVIHSTDLFYPHEDFDDVIDLMTMYSLNKMGEINLMGILLDDPAKQDLRPGGVYIDRLNTISRQNIPSTASHTTFLNWLEKSPEPVVVTVVGSLTNVWKAYQTNPNLCRQKIKEVWVFAGEAQEDPVRTHPRGRKWFHKGLEYNVSLDVPAFKGIMGSDLPIVWVPCYDGGHFNPNTHPSIGHNMVNGSYHRSVYGQILGNSSDEAKNFVVQGLRSCIYYPRPNVIWDRVASMDKSLFGVGVFRAIGTADVNYPFHFKEVNIIINSNGTIGIRSEGKTIRMFERTHPSRFYSQMTNLTANILSNL